MCNRPDPLSRLVGAEVVGQPIWTSSFHVGHRVAATLSSGNVYLAWAPLTLGAVPPQAPLPSADEWMFFAGLNPSGAPSWRKLAQGPPTPILPLDPGGPRGLGEISVMWYAPLRRWILAGSVQVPVNVARVPWGAPGEDLGATRRCGGTSPAICRLRR